MICFLHFACYRHVHYLHVMSYEYHSWYDDPHLRHQSPLYSKPDENPALNVVGAAAEVAVIEVIEVLRFIKARRVLK